MKILKALLTIFSRVRLFHKLVGDASGAEESVSKENILPLKKTLGASSGLSADSEEMDTQGSPRHIAIIMDGNNRWAKNNGGAVSGHRAGVEAIRDVLRGCERYNVEVLTLFAFSSENWLRPQKEVNELMSLFEDYLDSEVDELHKQGIALRFIGRRDRLGPSLVTKMENAEIYTQNNQQRVLVLAVDYGGRWDITQACNRAIQEAQNEEQVDERAFARYLSLSDLPDPDLCIRTGGEYRISNFLLWQFSYAELYFTECYWPDFNEHELSKAILTFNGRQRRFGRTSEQLVNDTEQVNFEITSSLEEHAAVKSRTHA